MNSEDSETHSDNGSMTFIHRQPTQPLLKAASVVASLVNERLVDRMQDLEAGDRCSFSSPARRKQVADKLLTMLN
jgi:hypothetical protein